MDNTRLKFLFHRYVNNNCTEAERTEFLNFVNDPGNEAPLKALMDTLWKEVSSRKLDPDHSERIINEILETNQINLPATQQSRFPWRSIAASLVIAVLFGAGIFYYSSSERRAMPGQNEAALPAPEPRFIKLADGSTVVLNEGSRLEYPAAFGASARAVSLVGEAYFDIAYDANRPFVVHTGKIKTTVLGTAFNIKAYPDQSDITVTVTRGKVKVSDDKKVLGIINPDQQITFNMTREFAEQKEVDSYAVASWIEKDIFFDDITISQALEQLEKRFNVSISLANDNISGCRFTATFIKGEDIVQILRILCDFNSATLQEKGAGVYVIEGGECPV